MVFALDGLRYPDDHLVTDLPDGSARLTRSSGSYRQTIVAGSAVQTGGAYTGNRPGRMIAR